MKKPWSKFKVVAGISLVFILGVVAGGHISAFYFKRHVAQLFDMGPPFRAERIKERLARDLALTQVQQEEIETIIDDSHKKMMGLFWQFQPKMKEIREQNFIQIRSKLTPEQQAEFDQIRKRFEHRFRHKPFFHHPNGRRFGEKPPFPPHDSEPTEKPSF